MRQAAVLRMQILQLFVSQSSCSCDTLLEFFSLISVCIKMNRDELGPSEIRDIFTIEFP